jgi:hypothetical protein
MDMVLVDLPIHVAGTILFDGFFLVLAVVFCNKFFAEPFHGKDGTLLQTNDLFRDTSEQEMFRTRQTVCCNHPKVGSGRCDKIDNAKNRWETTVS